MANEEVDFIPYAKLTPEQRALVDSEDWQARARAASQCLGLDKLAHDESHDVRREVAYQDFQPQTMILDENWTVRYAVASRHYGLDKLIVDSDEDVRMHVANNLKDMGLTIEEWISLNPDRCALPENQLADNLKRDFVPYADLTPEQKAVVDSTNPDQRFEAALQGWGLDRLVYDLKMSVRFATAVAGYGFDRLISDPNEMIQKHIYHVLEESGLTIEEWIDQNPDMCALPENKPASKEEIHAHELLAEYQAVMVDICRSLGAEPRVDIGDPTYYQEVIDNAVAELREPSLKNAVVLKQAGDDALLFTGGDVSPFVVALGYNPERKDWSAGTYYPDLRQAVCDFDRQFGTLAYSYDLSLVDLYPLLEEKGFEPTHENVRALMLNTNDFEDVSEYINESLTRLFDDEIDSCEEVLERSAAKTMPEKSFHARSVEEIKTQQQSHKPQGINPKDDLAMGREAASQSPHDHNRNIGRSR